jgi:molybdopterin synthase sulfur carrier subunit
MMLNILYFASLRETFGIANEEIAVPVPADVKSLVATLRQRGEIWSESLCDDKRWRVAVNQQMATMGTRLVSGDEVAIFPPVTGG